MLSCCFEAFSVPNSLKTSLFSQKMWLSQKEAQKYSESLFFLTSLKRGKSKENLDLFKQLIFVQTSKRGQIITKTVFLLKMSHILLNYAFLLFWSIFGEIHWKLLFLFKKLTILERSSEILRKITFLNKFEKEKIKQKIWISCKQPFLFKPVKGDKY